MAMKKKTDENYLEKVPSRNEDINWSYDEDDGNITLFIKNKGVFNKIFQVLLKKPEVTKVHLEEMGSFIWPLIDGKKSIMKIGEEVKAHFEDKAEPLYERLSKYFSILESYGFIKF